MAKLVSVKLRESTLLETKSILSKSSKSRNAYINEAVAFYNKLHKRKNIRQILREESKAVYSTSLEVLKDFEKFEEEIPE